MHMDTIPHHLQIQFLHRCSHCRLHRHYHAIWQRQRHDAQAHIIWANAFWGTSSIDLPEDLDSARCTGTVVLVQPTFNLLGQALAVAAVAHRHSVCTVAAQVAHAQIGVVAAFWALTELNAAALVPTIRELHFAFVGDGLFTAAVPARACGCAIHHDGDLRCFLLFGRKQSVYFFDGGVDMLAHASGRGRPELLYRY